MQFSIENLSACDRLAARFRRLQNPDARPLMASWTEIIRRDNERGVLAALDKHGSYMLAVTYRPKGPPLKLTKAHRGGVTGRQIGVFQGLGAANYGNLTSSEYRRLAGPPLAPRGRYSRVITNLRLEFARLDYGAGLAYGSSRWVAFGYWHEVVSRKGEKFLPYHFHGIGRTIQRDLTGVRPEGLALARKAAVAWMRDMVRSGGV